MEDNAEQLISAADYIKDNREKLVSVWEKMARDGVESASSAPRDKLRDHLSEVLLDLQTSLRKIDDTTTAREASQDTFEPKWSYKHGQSRAEEEEAYDAHEVLKEYVLLRQVLTDTLMKHGHSNLRCIEAVNSMFELASLHAVKAFIEAENEGQQKQVATLIHDIRSPMSVAISCLEVINDEPDDKEIYEELFPVIRRSAQRSLNMMSGLLDNFSASSKAGLTLYFEKTDLSPLFKDVLEEQVQLYGKNLVYEISTSKIEGYFACDILVRVANNLIANAFKYGSRNQQVSFRLLNEEDYIQLSVHNWGNPIPENKQIDIFGLFTSQQGHDEMPNKQGGWGLGLTHVKLAARAHGGDFQLSSNEETGTTFTVLLKKDHQTEGQKYFRFSEGKDGHTPLNERVES